MSKQQFFTALAAAFVVMGTVDAAVNCIAYPFNGNCVASREQYTKAELVQFWTMVKDLAISESTSSDSIIKGAVNCQQFPDAPYCIRARAQWAQEQLDLLAQEEEDAPMMGAVNCITYPFNTRCVSDREEYTNDELIEFWTLVKDQAISESTSSNSNIKGAVNCQQYPDAPYCIRARAQWAQEQLDLLLPKKETKPIRGALNCQQYPDAPFCVQARAQWAKEEKLGVGGTGFVSGVFEEDESLDTEMMSAVNCQAYPNTPFCIKARAQWAAELLEEEVYDEQKINVVEKIKKLASHMRERQ